MIISIDVEKAFDRISHYKKKKTRECTNRENIPKYIKVVCEKHTANIILDGVKLKTSSKVRNQTRTSLSPLSISWNNKAREGI